MKNFKKRSEIEGNVELDEPQIEQNWGKSRVSALIPYQGMDEK